jgi:alcohol dehydrogenase class IV
MGSSQSNNHLMNYVINANIEKIDQSMNEIKLIMKKENISQNEIKIIIDKYKSLNQTELSRINSIDQKNKDFIIMIKQFFLNHPQYDFTI